MQMAVLVCVSRPVGLAVVVIWERDEMVFRMDSRREEERRRGASAGGG